MLQRRFTRSPHAARRHRSYAPIMGAWVGRAWRRITNGPPADKPHRCMRHSLDGRCPAIVPAGEGVRQAGLVFCSPECALADQDDQPGT